MPSSTKTTRVTTDEEAEKIIRKRFVSLSSVVLRAKEPTFDRLALS
jgi:hypothetical protein